MIIYEAESLRSVESFLRGETLKTALIEEFGKDFSLQSPEEVIDFVCNYVESMTEFIVEKAMVSVLHCSEDAVDIVDTNHQVVRFNGKYYDYTARQYDDSFDENILNGNIPVIQPIIYTNDQVRPTISTIKYYVMLGEKK